MICILYRVVEKDVSEFKYDPDGKCAINRYETNVEYKNL